MKQIQCYKANGTADTMAHPGIYSAHCLLTEQVLLHCIFKTYNFCLADNGFILLKF